MGRVRAGVFSGHVFLRSSRLSDRAMASCAFQAKGIVEARRWSG